MPRFGAPNSNLSLKIRVTFRNNAVKIWKLFENWAFQWPCDLSKPCYYQEYLVNHSNVCISNFIFVCQVLLRKFVKQSRFSSKEIVPWRDCCFIRSNSTSCTCNELQHMLISDFVKTFVDNLICRSQFHTNTIFDVLQVCNKPLSHSIKQYKICWVGKKGSPFVKPGQNNNAPCC